VAEVTSPISRDDPFVRAWADHICAWVPGFPSGDTIFTEGKLAWAIASYICTVSVYHSSDHHSFSTIPIEEMPLRLRARLSLAEPVQELELDQVVSPEDHLRHQLFRAMFQRPVVLKSLPEVRYHLTEQREKQAYQRLARGMMELDERWARSTVPSSAQIACSIQY